MHSLRATHRGRSTSRTRGQALVEFALVIPVMLLLVVGGLDVGRLFFSWIEVNNAAREGAAYAGGNPTDTSGITSHVQTETNSQTQSGEGSVTVTVECANSANVTITCASAPGGSGTGNTVTVRVTRPFSFLTPVIGSILGNTIGLTGSATSAVYGLQPNDGSSASDPCGPPESAAFTMSISSYTVAVDASTSTPNSGRCAIASYAWDWGDGVDQFPPSVGKQTSYTYAGGTYTITLTVSNPGGNLSTTQSVTVPPPSPSPTASPTPSPTPTATPSPSPTNPCSMTPTLTYTEQGHSGKFNFFGAYTGQPAPASWFWWFGDGDVGSGQAPSQHRYSGSGPFTVTLQITNGSCSSSTSVSVSP